MFVQDAVTMLDRLAIELRSVTKVDVEKTFAALETCCMLAEVFRVVICIIIYKVMKYRKILLTYIVYFIFSLV